MHIFVTGGAGFIGSHLVRRALADPQVQRVTVYDNFSSGQRWHLEPVAHEARLRIIEGDVKDLPTLISAMAGADRVYHLASNPDIARAAQQPDIDFWEGTFLTQNVLEAMRVNRVGKLLYPSGSGVYGDVGEQPVAETWAPLQPVSTYGASKLACEALICAYCHLFEVTARAYRFANVVGPRQTHGVAFDFIRRLRQDPRRLRILGDGQQSKSYIHVDDVLDAMQWADAQSSAPFDVFNVATGDYLTVREIADLVVEEMGLPPGQVRYEFSGGSRGWKGDVPIVRFDLHKIQHTGWRAQRTSREAMRQAIRAMRTERPAASYAD